MLKKKYRLPIQAMLGKKGQTLKTSFLSLKIFPSNLSYSRFGAVISKKVAAKATARNKLRRIIFSAIEPYFGEEKKFFIDKRDFLVIIYPAVKDLSREEIKMHLREIFDKLK
ncbi:MAG: ribonuclease P protein component [Candidatus Harrisonbacteria bacterium]|nr:ribonuclease P protein component [Candidatus Harrisonbacteria bacterium]